MSFDQIIELIRTASPAAIALCVVLGAFILRGQLRIVAGRITRLKVGGNEVALEGQQVHNAAVARAYTERVVELSGRIRENQRAGILEAMMVSGDEGLQQYMAQIEADAMTFIANLDQADAETFSRENDIALARIEPALHRAIRRAMIDNHIPAKADHEAFTAYVKNKALTLDGAGMQIRRAVVWNRHLHDRFLAFSRERDEAYLAILSIMFDRAGQAEAEMLEKIAADQASLDTLRDQYCKTARCEVEGCEE